MIGLPPSVDGAVQLSEAERSPAVALRPVGGPGGGDGTGVIWAVGADSGPAPAALRAATVNVYAVPLVRPPTLKLVDAEPVSREACLTPLTYSVTR